MAKRRITKQTTDVVSELDKLVGEMFLQSFKEYLEGVIREGEEKRKNVGKPTKEISQHKML